MPIVKRTTKLYKRKKPQAVKKVVSTTSTSKGQPLQRLSAISLYHNKLISILYDTARFQYRLLTEAEANTGGGFLQFNTAPASQKSYPLHIYDITGINNDNNLFTPLNILSQDAANLPYFVPNGSTLKMSGLEGGSEYSIVRGHNKTLMNYLNLKIELFGRENLNTHYKLMLLKIKDEELIPKLSANASNERHNAFWSSMVRPFITHSMLSQDSRTLADLKGRYKVLWQKDYRLKEKSADYDILPRKLVKIFRPINQIKNYNENQRHYFVNNDDPSNLVENNNGQNTSFGSSSTECSVRERIYFIILANSTTDANSVNGVDTNDSGSRENARCYYNLTYETKHTIPNQVE